MMIDPYERIVTFGRGMIPFSFCRYYILRDKLENLILERWIDEECVATYYPHDERDNNGFMIRITG